MCDVNSETYYSYSVEVNCLFRRPSRKDFGIVKIIMENLKVSLEIFEKTFGKKKPLTISKMFLIVQIFQEAFNSAACTIYESIC